MVGPERRGLFGVHRKSRGPRGRIVGQDYVAAARTQARVGMDRQGRRQAARLTQSHTTKAWRAGTQYRGNCTVRAVPPV